MRFGTQYQHDLLSRMTVKSAMQDLGKILSADLFDPDLEPVAEELIGRWKKSGAVLSPAQLRQLCHRHSVKLQGSNRGDLQFDRETVLLFARHQALRRGLTQAHMALDEMDFDGVKEAIANIQLPGAVTELPNVLTRKREIPKRKGVIPLGFPTLDEDIKGGVAVGDLLTFLGPISGGKTTVLIYLACRTAEQGKKVVYYTLDAPGEQIEARIWNYFCQQENPPRKLWEKCISQVEKKGGVLHLVEHPPDTLSLAALESELPDKCDLLIVDYADYLVTPKHFSKEDYQGLGKLYSGLKALGKRKNFPVATASQLRRISYEDKDFGRVEDVELSLRKMMITDISVSINVTGKPGPEGKSPVTLFLAKNRYGPGSTTYMVDIHWAQCRITAGKYD